MASESTLSEAAVREEIIAPVLKELGYRSNSANDIRYELNLRYPRDFLGHKKPTTDPPIRGKADYVCYAGGRVAWTVEAKPSGPDFTIDDVEQAAGGSRAVEHVNELPAWQRTFTRSNRRQMP